MSLVEVIRLLTQNIKMILVVAITFALLIAFATRNPKKSFKSSSVVYTGLASGLTIEGNTKVDFFGTSNQFDNFLSVINSRETKEEVALRLIASHLLIKELDPTKLTWGSMDHLNKLFSKELKEKLIDTLSEEMTYRNLLEHKESNDTNAVFKLLYGKDGHYSLEAMNKIKCERVNSSDFVKIDFESDDPGICKKTLELNNEVLIKNFVRIKQNQSSSVLEYFVSKTEDAKNKLADAEKALLKYKKDKNVINYYEQTKYISAEKESLDDKINTVNMDKSASLAVLRRIEANLSEREKVKLYSEEIIRKRDSLSAISSRLALSELSNKDSLRSNERETSILLVKSIQLKNELTKRIHELYDKSRSISGLPTDELLSSWLQNIVVVDESDAKLLILRARQKEFSDIYKTMAPIGAQIKKLERDIEVAEDTYLNLLHNLGQAQIREQNFHLSSNISVADKPFFPVKAKKSSRGIMVGIGGFGGFVMAFSIVILMEFLNSTMKSPSIASKQIDAEVLSAYPNMMIMKRAKVDLDIVRMRLSELFTKKIYLEVFFLKKSKPPIIVNVISILNGEGKSFVISLFRQKLLELNKKSIQIIPSNSDLNGISEDREEGTYLYDLNPNFYNSSSLTEFFLKKDIQIHEMDYVFMEYPNLLENQYPTSLVDEADIHMLVARANRAWNKADADTLESYERIAGSRPKVFLNGTKLEVLETLIGEVPKKRSFIRRAIKRWARFEFKSRRKF